MCCRFFISYAGPYNWIATSDDTVGGRGTRGDGSVAVLLNLGNYTFFVNSLLKFHICVASSSFSLQAVQISLS
jgi:hypothetical protein